MNKTLLIAVAALILGPLAGYETAAHRTGPAGPPGPAGPQGDTGDKGDPGDPGDPGRLLSGVAVLVPSFELCPRGTTATLDEISSTRLKFNPGNDYKVCTFG